MLITWRPLTLNEYSRPGDNLVVMSEGRATRVKKSVQGIVTHWVENPETDAEFNWRYFEERKLGRTGFGSAEFIVSDRTILQTMTIDDDVAFHVGSGRPFPEGYTPWAIKRFAPYPSAKLVGVEWCHLDWEGRPSSQTRDSCVWLYSGLCAWYSLDPLRDIVLHRDITGKDCHRWFVKRPREFEQFRHDVLEVTARIT